jgi:hypothetical protein
VDESRFGRVAAQPGTPKGWRCATTEICLRCHSTRSRGGSELVGGPIGCGDGLTPSASYQRVNVLKSFLPGSSAMWVGS